MNNPLNLTDPSGYSAWTRIRGFVVAVVAAVADAYGCAGYCSQAVQYYNTAKTAQAYYNAYQQGGWSAVGKTYLRSTLSDIVGRAAFGGSGDVGVGQEYGLKHYAATAAAGCVSSVASGGKCGSGAAAAVAGKFATQMTDGGDLNSQTRYLIAQAAGGLASEVAGGKFANGAQTAAYGYLFNAMSGKFNVSTGRLTANDPATGARVEAYALTSVETGGKGAAPDGYYYVVDLLPGSGQWRLEPADGPFGDGVHNASGRNGFWLHFAGTVSKGCITCVEGGNQLRSFLETTSPLGNVSVQTRYPWFLGGGDRTVSAPVLGVIQIQGNSVRNLSRQIR
jgi:hypothetical protein